MKNKGQAKKGTMKRLIRMLFEFYPVLLPLVLVCIVLNALISSIPAIFQQNIIAVVEQYWQTKDWAAAAPTVTRLVLILLYCMRCLWQQAMRIPMEWRLSHRAP